MANVSQAHARDSVIRHRESIENFCPRGWFPFLLKSEMRRKNKKRMSENIEKRLKINYAKLLNLKFCTKYWDSRRFLSFLFMPFREAEERENTQLSRSTCRIVCDRRDAKKARNKQENLIAFNSTFDSINNNISDGNLFHVIMPCYWRSEDGEFENS